MKPGVWESVPCDPAVTAELAALARSRRLPPSLLFCGPPGAGKRAAALAVAQAMVCTDSDAPCGTCSACRRAAAGYHPDFQIWEAEGRDVKVEQARALRASTHLKPFEAAMQVHLIPEAERLNDEAANALLKTLEEPSPHAVVILLAIAPSLLLPTIRSRCRLFRFPPMEESAVRSRLEKEDALPPPEAAWRARLARGSLSRARELQADEPQRAADALQVLEALAGDPSPGGVVAAAERWAGETPPTRPIERLLEICRDAILAAENVPTDTLLHPDLQPALARLGAALPHRLPATVERLEGALGDLRRPMKPQLLIEEACLQLLGLTA